MSREKRLQPVLKLAQGKVDEAAKALGYLNSKIAEEQATHSQLKNYESEYLQLMRGGSEPNRRMDVQAVMRYQLFIQRLEAAQIQQNEQIKVLEEQKAQVTQHWIKTQARAKGIGSVIETARQEDAIIANRQEQKLFDEFNSQKASRQS